MGDKTFGMFDYTVYQLIAGVAVMKIDPAPLVYPVSPGKGTAIGEAGYQVVENFNRISS